MSNCPQALQEFLNKTLKRGDLQVTRYERLSGGAIQQNLALDLVSDDGLHTMQLVLRTDSTSSVDVSMTRAQEFSVLSAAFEAGALAPRPICQCDDSAVIGAPFFLMSRIEGTTAAHSLTRSSALDAEGRKRLMCSIGEALAQVHAIPIDDSRLAFLGRHQTADVLSQRVAFYRSCLDELNVHRPVLEWALLWLSRQSFQSARQTFCHNDFRTGNLMIDGDKLVGILDWEFAGIGDPHEDLGWFCAPCWRFAARDREAGGLGDREDFYKAYERASGKIIDRSAMPCMEILATIRWAVIALQQGARFDSGKEPTLELALTGRMIAELEQDLILLLPAAAAVGAMEPTSAVAANAVISHDSPTALPLIEAAREHLLQYVLPDTKAQNRYSVLMVANALRMAVAELDAKAESAESHSIPQLQLRRQLSQQLRDGVFDSLFDQSLLKQLQADVTARLHIANPRRLSP